MGTRINQGLGLFREKAGGQEKYSATRFVFILWGLVVLAMWGYISLQNGELEKIPNSVATIMGLLAGGKVIQRFGE